MSPSKRQCLAESGSDGEKKRAQPSDPDLGSSSPTYPTTKLPLAISLSSPTASASSLPPSSSLECLAPSDSAPVNKHPSGSKPTKAKQQELPREAGQGNAVKKEALKKVVFQLKRLTDLAQSALEQPEVDASVAELLAKERVALDSEMNLILGAAQTGGQLSRISLAEGRRHAIGLNDLPGTVLAHISSYLCQPGENGPKLYSAFLSVNRAMRNHILAAAASVEVVVRWRGAHVQAQRRLLHRLRQLNKSPSLRLNLKSMTSEVPKEEKAEAAEEAAGKPKKPQKGCLIVGITALSGAWEKVQQLTLTGWQNPELLYLHVPFTSLTTLVLQGGKLSRTEGIRGILALSRCPQLSCVELRQCDVDFPEVLLVLLGTLPHLLHLVLQLKEGADQVYLPSSCPTGSLTKLQHLDVSDSVSWRHSFMFAAKMPELTHLSFSLCRQPPPTPCNYRMLLISCKNLRSLILPHARIDDAVLELLLFLGSSITHLRVSGFKLSSSFAERPCGWKRLDVDCPTCETLNSLPLRSLSHPLSSPIQVDCSDLENLSRTVTSMQSTIRVVRQTWEGEPLQEKRAFTLQLHGGWPEGQARGSLHPYLPILRALSPLAPHLSHLHLTHYDFHINELTAAHMEALGEAHGATLRHLTLQNLWIEPGSWTAIPRALPCLEVLELTSEHSIPQPMWRKFCSAVTRRITVKVHSTVLANLKKCSFPPGHRAHTPLVALEQGEPCCLPG